MEYLARVLDEELAARLRSTGAVLIEGPKFCGKTETAARVSQTVRRLDTADGETAAVAPELLFEGDTPVLLDEWQIFPELWDRVRRQVDDRQAKGQFILTGSATPAEDARRHSGAGRIATLRMRPMSLFESGHSTGEVSLAALFNGEPARCQRPDLTIPDVIDRVVVGGWPLNIALPVDDAARENRDYLSNLVHKDVPRLGSRRDPENLMRLIRSLARNTGGETSIATLAADVGGDGPVATQTVRDYLDALTRLHVTEDLPAWAPHMRSKTPLRKQPKRYLTDPSLAAAALRVGPKQLLADMNATRHLFEALVLRDIRVYSQPLDGTAYHWRDNNQKEVDLILSLAEGRWAAIEIKMASDQATTAKGAETLLSFVDKVDTAKVGEPAFLAVVTGSGVGYRRPDGVDVVPISALRP